MSRRGLAAAAARALALLLLANARAHGRLHERIGNHTHNGNHTRDGCALGDLSNAASFAAAARMRASSSSSGDGGSHLLIFEVNVDYVPLAVRLVGNLARVGVHNYLAVGYDAAACAALLDAGVCGCGHLPLLAPHAAGVAAWRMDATGGFSTRLEKTALFLVKLQALVWAVEAGVRRVMHCDLDIALLADPFAALMTPSTRFAHAALAMGVDVPDMPAALRADCAAAVNSTNATAAADDADVEDAVLNATVPRPSLNTGLMLMSSPDARGAAVALLNETLNVVVARIDAAVAQPPAACGAACPMFPDLPDWDQIWEQAVLKALAAAHMPPRWSVGCGAAHGSAQHEPYAWAPLTWPAAREERLAALPEWAGGRMCALRARLAAAASSTYQLAPGEAPDAASFVDRLLNRSATGGLLRGWPRPLAAAHLVFTPAATRLSALRALGFWHDGAHGGAAKGRRAGTACFGLESEPVVLLSMPPTRPDAALLLLCTEEPQEADGAACCVQLDAAAWPWPVEGLPEGDAAREHVRDTFPGCVHWEWK
jgi:hypothetical protein